MKKLFQIIALCLLLATLCGFAVACKDSKDPGASSSSSSSSSSSQKPPEYKDPTYGLTENLDDKNDPGDTQ